MGLFSELKLAVPWGHIAAKAWGSQKGSPILCLHGWLDNANSFDRLIPLLPRDFYYVAMDFGGHGLSSHYSPGLPYYYQNFVGEIRRVSAALKWDRFSIMGHSFGGTVGGMFSCMFPEMVDKLILLDSSPFALDSNPLPRVSRMERGTPGASWKPLSGTPPVCTPPFGVTARVSQELENLLTYKRKAIEHTLLVEQAAGEPRALRPQEMLQRLLKNNSHVGEECGELLLQRGATQVPAGLVLNRDRRIAWVSATALLPSRACRPLLWRNVHSRVFILFIHFQSTPSISSARSCVHTPSRSCRPTRCSSRSTEYALETRTSKLLHTRSVATLT
ncbi:serine hydrolase-like protein 2 isoform X9 [Myotis myotis]|uniref:serine hydrolase-like protein 2 isoform X9 n=1 Tax=Myotis myotis TaxID=51298 RepID=UPI001749BB4B|nr:serine hydrolase-like protein 2 isoform X9 [Myotis myotis]